MELNDKCKKLYILVLNPTLSVTYKIKVNRNNLYEYTVQCRLFVTLAYVLVFSGLSEKY